MAKKLILKSEWCQKVILIVNLSIMRKKPTKGEKAKDKLKLKKYNPNTRKHEYFVEKNYHLIVNNYFLPKFLNS